MAKTIKIRRSVAKPKRVIPNKNGLSESQIQKMIINYLNIQGWITIRQNSAATVVDDRFIRAYSIDHKTLPSATSSGMPDIQALRNGRTLFIECKTAKGKTTANQDRIHELLRKQDFEVLIARDLDDVINYFKQPERANE